MKSHKKNIKLQKLCHRILTSKIVFCSVFVLFISNTYSQDPTFSQFYANPLYLNPALVGTSECSRLMVNYRNQWPSLENNFVTFSASADHYIDALSGGVGLIFSSDNAGGEIMNTLRISGIYSYHLMINNNTSLNAGFQATYHQQKLQWEKLIFPDMIDPSSGAVNPGSSDEDTPENTSVSVADFSLGLLLGIQKKYFLGAALNHVTQPDLNYYSNTEGNPLYLKYTLHAGANFGVGSVYSSDGRNRFSIIPNILYQYQQNASQLNVGLNAEISPLIIGVWYRRSFQNPDAILFIFGIKQKRFKFGYSYDVSLSKLKGNSGGAHEASLTFYFDCDKKRNKPGAIKCPEF